MGLSLSGALQRHFLQLPLPLPPAHFPCLRGQFGNEHPHH